MASSHDMRTSRTLGALLGVHTGDSLGATLEFKPWFEVASIYPDGLREIVGGGPFDWPAGAATDDTDLTRAVLLAYQDYHAVKESDRGTDEGEFNVARAAADYALKWYEGEWPGRKKGSRPVDIGNATTEGLSRYKRIKDLSKSGAGKGSAGNGSLMRCIPTALFAVPASRRDESMAISEFTHNDARCTVACAVYNEIVAALVRGVAPKEAVDLGKAVAARMKSAAVRAAIEEGEQINLELAASEGTTKHNVSTSGYVLSSLKLSIAAVLDERSFEDVLVDVVCLGGDSDTNGAIAGGLLGARDGVEKIPERWLEKLQFGREFKEVAMRILEVHNPWRQVTARHEERSLFKNFQNYFLSAFAQVSYFLWGRPIMVVPSAMNASRSLNAPVARLVDVIFERSMMVFRRAYGVGRFASWTEPVVGIIVFVLVGTCALVMPPANVACRRITQDHLIRVLLSANTPTAVFVLCRFD
ncbi:ADP-ribosylglycohydrolase-domain-containing protein [Phaeosphaeria sp. MPI-PUGE-AT-0046c]|nr:ADP-ribosylglycohydrolase-domain-containing protein [Phaeosphaeria sp. MPI-PUGE-AT-0046c]